MNTLGWIANASLILGFVSAFARGPVGLTIFAWWLGLTLGFFALTFRW